MKERLAVNALACAVIVGGLTAVPAEAQIPVTDVAHIAATEMQTVRDEWEWVEHALWWYENYKQLDEVFSRDTQEYIDRVSGALHHGDAQTVAGEHARKLYSAVYNAALTMRPCPDGTWDEEFEFTDEWLLAGEFDCVPANRWADYWRQVQHDTFYGVLDASWQVREGVWRAGPEIDELRRQLTSATGNSQKLEAVGAIALSQLEQTRLLNDQLTALTQLQVAKDSFRQTMENVSANTAEELLYYEGWDDEVVYTDYAEMPSFERP